MSVFHDPAVIDLEHGVTAEYVIGHLKQLPEEAIRTVIQEQVDAGNVYNTIDDYHYKSVMNG
uniref:Replication protein A C-terminal domain-containing protein n=1 Tax=Arundo donax TaxID=35708 RepID=A0A0A9F528_ARUDO